jgi:AcrR family transcriptional regulator
VALGRDHSPQTSRRRKLGVRILSLVGASCVRIWAAAFTTASKERDTVMRSPNRVGGESSTRDALLNSTEQIMLEDGYAAVTYRNVAAKAGASLGSLQHHFPSLDDLFIGVLRRYSERNREMLVNGLHANPDDTLGVIWAHSGDELSTALLMEFVALANHRKSIHAEIAEVTEEYRRIQLDALTENWGKLDSPMEDLTPAAVLFLLGCLPKWMLLEASFGATGGHAEICALVQRYLNRAQPSLNSRKPSRVAATGKVPGGRR